jgi:transcription elongation factor Elf1
MNVRIIQEEPVPYKDIERQKEYQHNHYLKNKPKRMQGQKDKRGKAKKWLAEYKKSLACLVCGEDEGVCLDFHHLDETKKSFTISTAVGRTASIDDVLQELEKCVVLCSNCHRKFHAGLLDLSPHIQ